MLSGKDHGVSAKRVGREVDVGAVVGDLFNAGVGSANRLLGEEFGVLASESATGKYVPVLGHVEEAASVVESTRGWLRPVEVGVGEAPPLGNLVGIASGATRVTLVGGCKEAWDTPMEEGEDLVLGGYGEGEMSENELNASYNGEDMSEGESDGDEEVLKQGISSCRGCEGAVARMELRLWKLTSMVSLLMADRGLTGYGELQRCEKERRRCAQNRSEGLKKSQQDASLGALKSRAEVLEKKRRAAELLAEEEAKRQARELEQVDANLEMAAAERERAIASVVGARGREEVVVASEKVTYAMAAADAAAKRREEIIGEGVVVGGGFQVVQGKKLRSVEVVTIVVGKVDREKR